MMGNLWVFPYERLKRELMEDKMNRAQFVQVAWNGLTPSEAKQTMSRLFKKNVRYVFDDAYAKTYTIPPQSVNFVTFLTVDGLVQGWIWEANGYFW